MQPPVVSTVLAWCHVLHAQTARHRPLSNPWLLCRYDFYQLLVDLELSDAQDTQQQLQDLADTAFRCGQRESVHPWAALGSTMTVLLNRQVCQDDHA